ncbi:hypothetical protein RIF29_29228 [Crotalaria pallida]|uniref:RING-type domain-containing protein n=1 Tax=Crotalaria pallida TaxID=3830 RepID=A0AAN9EED0_CROPI
MQLCYIYRGEMDNDVKLALFFICLIIFTIFLTFASWVCTTTRTIGETVRGSNQSVAITVESEPRIDQITLTLARCPSLQFSKAKLCNNNSTSSSCFSCSICLVDYKESDFVRVLPSCDHFFHASCVDPWLRMNLTCPICRKTIVTASSDPTGAV